MKKFFSDLTHYGYNYLHTALIGLMLFCSLSYCSCSQNTIKSKDWWIDPCQEPVPHPYRHGRSADDTSNVTSVVEQLIKHTTTAIHRISTLYKMEHITKYHPKGALRLNVNLAIHNLTHNNKKFNMRLYYRKLQFFARIIHKTMNMSPITDIPFNRRARSKVIYNLSPFLRAVLCEVQCYIKRCNNVKIPRPERIYNIPKTLDKTSMWQWDISVLSKLRRYLKKSQKIMRGLTKRSKPACSAKKSFPK